VIEEVEDGSGRSPPVDCFFKLLLFLNSLSSSSGSSLTTLYLFSEGTAFSPLCNLGHLAYLLLLDFSLFRSCSGSFGVNLGFPHLPMHAFIFSIPSLRYFPFS